MAHIPFVVEKPKVTFTDHSLWGSYGWSLSFAARLGGGWDESVALTTEEGDLKNMSGGLSFVDAEKGEAWQGFETGSLSYWKGHDDPIEPTPPMYTIQLRMPGVEIERLMKTIADGLPLVGVTVVAKDMSYGWAPDGSEKKWDNAEKTTVEIEGFRLFFGQPEDQSEEVEPEEYKVDTEPKILMELREVRRTMHLMLLALVAVIIATVIFQ